MQFSFPQFQQLVNQAYEQAASQNPEHLEHAVGTIVQNPITMEKSVIPIVANPNSVMPLDPFCQTISQLFVQELACHTYMTSLDAREVRTLGSQDRACLWIDPFYRKGAINSDSRAVSLKLAKMLLAQEEKTQETASAAAQQMQLQPQLSHVVTQAAMMPPLKRAATEELLPEAPAAKRMAPETTTTATGAPEQPLIPLPAFDPSIFLPPIIVGDDDEELAIPEDLQNIDVSTMAVPQAEDVEGSLVVTRPEVVKIQLLLDQIESLIRSHGESAYGFIIEGSYHASKLSYEELRFLSPEHKVKMAGFANEVIIAAKEVRLSCFDVNMIGSCLEGKIEIEGLNNTDDIFFKLKTGATSDTMTLSEAKRLLNLAKQQANKLKENLGQYESSKLKGRNPDRTLTSKLMRQMESLTSFAVNTRASLLGLSYAQYNIKKRDIS